VSGKPRAPAAPEAAALGEARDARQARERGRSAARRGDFRGRIQVRDDDDEFAHRRYRTAIVRFTLEAGGAGNLIRSYSGEEIRIGERAVRESCLVTATELLTQWGPQQFAEFTSAHLAPLIALAPELVIVGTGLSQQFAPLELRHALARHGIGLEAMQLGAACRTFNVLVQEERRVAAALFLR
jgi:uncharacterized protein